MASLARRYSISQDRISLTGPGGNFQSEGKREISDSGKRRTSYVDYIEKTDNLSYVKNDLVKIVLTAAIIITAQIILGLTLSR